MKSGAGVLLIGSLELLCGTALLAIYETSKTAFYRDLAAEAPPAGADASAAAAWQFASAIERNLGFRTPLDFLFWAASLNNIAALFGLVGILAAQRELVVGFFVYNAAQLVLTLNFFVDVLVDVSIRFPGAAPGLNGHEAAAAAVLFANLLLSAGATFFAVKAVREIRQKSREEYNRISVLPDSLAFDDARLPR